MSPRVKTLLPAIVEKHRGFNPPLGLLYLAGYLEEHTDHDVEVVAPRKPRSQPPDWKNRLPMFGAQGCGKR